jgi:hypothetical protein
MSARRQATLGIYIGGDMSEERPTAKQRADAKQARKRQEMEQAIADGRLKVRQMTPKERKEADRLRAIRADERAERAARRAARG